MTIHIQLSPAGAAASDQQLAAAAEIVDGILAKPLPAGTSLLDGTIEMIIRLTTAAARLAEAHDTVPDAATILLGAEMARRLVVNDRA